MDELLELYSEAVEFYNSRMDKKFLYYETKMQTLLVRPEVMVIMQPPK